MSDSASKLTRRILIGMGLGIVLGIVLRYVGNEWVQTWVLGGALRALGDIFKASLSMLVVPLVFVSLFVGTASLSDPAKLGRLSVKTISLYLLTTLLAVSFALLLALLVQPGSGVAMVPAEYLAPQAPAPLDVLIGMVPTNPIRSMAEGHMLQIIVFALLLGIAAAQSGDAGKRVSALMGDLNTVVLRLVGLVMELAPYGVFALLATTVAQLGVDAIVALAQYFGLVLLALLVHLLVTYPLLFKLLSGLDPRPWLRKMRPVMLFAFATSSSNATIPVTLRQVEHGMGAHKSVSSFTVPLGATLNMDGTAIMQGVATVFIAQVYQVDLTTTQLVTVVAMATLASIGTAGVPSAGMVMLAGVLAQVGLPVEGIGMILGIDRLLDMTRTAVNVSGDAMVTCVVARSENALDLDVYNDPNAGADTRLEQPVAQASAQRDGSA